MDLHTFLGHYHDLSNEAKLYGDIIKKKNPFDAYTSNGFFFLRQPFLLSVV